MAKEDVIKFYGENTIKKYQDLYLIPDNSMIFSCSDKTIASLPTEDSLNSYLLYMKNNDNDLTGAISYFYKTLREFRCWLKDEERKTTSTLPMEEVEEDDVPPGGTIQDKKPQEFNIQDILTSLDNIKELCEVSANDELLIKLYDKLSDVEGILESAKKATSTKKAEYQQVEELSKKLDSLNLSKVTKVDTKKTEGLPFSNKTLIAILLSLTIMNVLMIFMQVIFK